MRPVIDNTVAGMSIRGALAAFDVGTSVNTSVTPTAITGRLTRKIDPHQ